MNDADMKKELKALTERLEKHSDKLFMDEKLSEEARAFHVNMVVYYREEAAKVRALLLNCKEAPEPQGLPPLPVPS